jgi:uncharacterized protein (DUF433 family)
MALTKLDTPTESDLLAMVKQDPLRPGRMYGRLKGYEVPVWGIVQHMVAEYDLADPLAASDAVVERAASDYDLPPVAIRAALAYYKHNRPFIDAKIESNAAGTLG